MLWDHGSALAPLATRESLPPDDPHFPQYDELNVYEHALTIMYGMNAYILIADIDEYMILPQPLTLPSIHNALMQGMVSMLALWKHEQQHASLLYNLASGCLATGAPAHRVSRFAFPQCPPAQPEVFVACASEQMKQGKGTLVKFESGDPLPKVCGTPGHALVVFFLHVALAPTHRHCTLLTTFTVQQYTKQGPLCFRQTRWATKYRKPVRTLFMQTMSTGTVHNENNNDLLMTAHQGEYLLPITYSYRRLLHMPLRLPNNTCLHFCLPPQL